MENYFKNILSTVDKSIQSMDMNRFQTLINDCYRVLLGGGKVIASGLGKNVPICEKFVGTMNSLGMAANFLHTNTAVHGDLGMIRKNDIVLLLSKSGNTQESLLLAEHLKSRGTDTWLITFNEDSKIVPFVNNTLILNLENEGDPWDIVPNNSTTVYLIILQGLAMQLVDKMGITLVDFKVNHPGGRIGEILRGEK